MEDIGLICREEGGKNETSGSQQVRILCGTGITDMNVLIETEFK